MGWAQSASGDDKLAPLAQFRDGFDNSCDVVADRAVLSDHCSQCRALLGEPAHVGVERITAEDFITNRNESNSEEHRLPQNEKSSLRIYSQRAMHLC
jgi:hypothetical protein